VVLIISSLLSGGILLLKWQRELPDIEQVRAKIKEGLSQSTIIYDIKGEPISQIFLERRSWVSLEKIPIYLRQAFIAAEDNRFYKHKGVDLRGIIRAAWADIKARKVVQGGSTITQQVAKLFFLTPKRSIKRKVKEILLARRLEALLSKDEILELYLNLIYFGSGAYGVEEAAKTYFGKHVWDLNLPECAALAAIPRSPARYNLFRHPENNKERREYVLERMLQEGYITSSQMFKAKNAKLKLVKKERSWADKAPYFTEMIRQYLVSKYGSEEVYQKGLKVYTTLDLRLQKIAQEALKEGLRELDKKENPYRGPLGNIENDFRLTSKEYKKGKIYKAIVKRVLKDQVIVDLGKEEGVIPHNGLSWIFKKELKGKKITDILKEKDIILVRIRKKASDGRWILSLEQEPEVEGALVCIDLTSGEIRALVGGYDFERSKFNRVLQAHRQPGSAFKPIIYTAAMDTGFTPASIILDAPITFEMQGPEEEAKAFLWKPENYTEKFYGPTRLRVALAHSRNVVTIKLLKKMGIKVAIRYARKLGIKSPLRADLSLALGGSEVTPMELTRAYTTFPTGGKLIEPIFIKKVEDREGHILEENRATFTPVIPEDTAYVMTSLLESVIKEGTGKKAQALQRPCAGKTGTTNEFRDAWFIGFTPRLITGVYVGYDDHRPLGYAETGARAALPIWLSFMKQAVANDPPEPFSVPSSVVFAKIDPDTGMLASFDNPKAQFEVFKQGTEPKTPQKEAPAEEIINQDVREEAYQAIY